MRARVSAFLLVVCLVAVAVIGAAQARGDVRGIVRNPSGAVMPGVMVLLTGVEARSAITNDKGEFAFAGVAAGSYKLTFSHTGFATLEQSIVVGTTNRPVVVQMRVGDMAVPPPPPAPMAAPAAPPVRVGGALDRLYMTMDSAVAGGVVGGAWSEPGRRGRDTGNESYESSGENAFVRAGEHQLSTFSIDVDTASYANVRRFLNDGMLPPPAAVRIEELINYFHFDYPQPAGKAPFSVTTELAECPWNTQHRLALIGLQGRQLPNGETPPRNLVFLIDVSGSMESPDKLPLVQHGMRMLARTLNDRDRVAIVVYAGNSGLVLPTTNGNRRERIERAIADLRAGGSTNGGAGIQLAYHIAREQFVKGGVNRVILATDGDFNVGVTNQDDLVHLIEHERESGVFLSVLGVGTGNLKDSTMEKLADKGNGNYSYLDSLQEAQRVLVKESGSTLVTIAKDVKIQIEFNPTNVSAYRLIGYENRVLADKDFNDDKKDAGEMGAGHTVTAIYEIVPVGVEIESSPSIDPLKYAPAPKAAEEKPRAQGNQFAAELLTVKLRYKAPDSDRSELISSVVNNRPATMGANLGFASAVAEAGMLLRGSKHAGQGAYASAVTRARKFRGEDPDGYRAEFIRLTEIAASLSRSVTTQR